MQADGSAVHGGQPAPRHECRAAGMKTPQRYLISAVVIGFLDVKCDQFIVSDSHLHAPEIEGCLDVVLSGLMQIDVLPRDVAY